MTSVEDFNKIILPPSFFNISAALSLQLSEPCTWNHWPDETVYLGAAGSSLEASGAGPKRSLVFKDELSALFFPV